LSVLNGSNGAVLWPAHDQTVCETVLVVEDNPHASLCDVRFWPKADIPSCTAHVRFRG